MQVPTLTQGVDPDAGVDRQLFQNHSVYCVYCVYCDKKGNENKSKTNNREEGGAAHTKREDMKKEQRGAHTTYTQEEIRAE